MSEWLQLAIGAAIIGLVLFTVWRAGAANPEGTGRLRQLIDAQAAQLGTMETKVKGCASRNQVDQLGLRMENLERHMASSGEVVAIEGKINSLNAEVTAKLEGMKASADRTEAGVRRIEGYFLQKGVDGR